MKKILTALLALTMVFALSVPAFADGGTISTAGGTSSVPVTLTTAGASFSVTVPTAFPVNVAANGTVTVADNLKIVNNSKGQIKVTSVVLNGANSWSVVDYATDFSKQKADTKAFGFKLQGKNVAAGGVADISGFTAVDGNGGELPISYDANIAVQSSAMTDATIASAVFTIGWNS